MTRKFECYSGCGFISVDAYTIEVIDGLSGVCPVCGLKVLESDFSEVGPVEVLLDKLATNLAARLTAVLAADVDDRAHTLTQRLGNEANRQRTQKKLFTRKE